MRIEDTDRARSTQAAVDAILDGMQWLGLNHDGEVIYQFARQQRHAAVAHTLLAQGKAYYCYASAAELEEMRAQQKAQGLPQRYDGRWRDDGATPPSDIKPTIRLKAPQTGETVIDDIVQGTVTVQNSQLDDMVLLRGDGTPTYMLSVVVDDYDMNITHVVRGDDHFTNTFRQKQIYDAMGWVTPIFAHVPMIHGDDGHKLSKRHGAVSVQAYRDDGFLPEAMRNYLLRLGWGHGDAEILSTDEMLALFSLDGIGRAPSRFDIAKLTNLNAHYLHLKNDDELAAMLQPQFAKLDKIKLIAAIALYKSRCKTLVELHDAIQNLFAPIKADIDAAAKPHVQKLVELLAAQNDTTPAAIEDLLKRYVADNGLKFKDVGMPMRLALVGTTNAPAIGEIINVLGMDETLIRLKS